MDTNSILQTLNQQSDKFLTLLNSPELYAQLGLIVTAIIFAYGFSAPLQRSMRTFSTGAEAKRGLPFLRQTLYAVRDLVLPLFIILFLTICVDLSDSLVKQSWLVRIVQGLAVVLLFHTIIKNFVQNLFIKIIFRWVLIPAAVLQVFGVLEKIVTYLESLNIEIGNIDISVYGIIRVTLFGAILFWLGRMSNIVGQRVIRQQKQLDIGTREVLAKIFQVGVFLLIFLLLLQVMGINITALAVFGGALGVGLGFGLQAIASNFISGIILLLDRSLSVGDYIELADGRKGTIRELNMRSTLLETYDGKDIMVPNEQFITTSFTNWTHKNKKQRYSIEFQVAYSTDLHKLFDLLRKVVANHPRVLSGDDLPIEERPDAEICGFGESGVDILIEFWMEGIDDGENRVGGDLYLMIWDALKENNVQIPFPQREVKIVQVGQE